MRRHLARTLIAAWCAAILLPAGAAARSACVVDRHGNTLCPPARAECAQDRYGDWHCSAPGGAAVLDRHGQPVCGVGRCVVDRRGDVKCSTVPDGAVALDRYGEAVCAHGCTSAERGLCAALRR